MKSKHLIYSLLVAVLTTTLFSCDPVCVVAFNNAACSLTICNVLEYPVAIKTNYDFEYGGVLPEGEKSFLLDPLEDVSLVSNFHYGSSDTPFKDIWNHSVDNPIYYRLYRLDLDTYEEVEFLIEWDEDSAFFEKQSWRVEYGDGGYDQNNRPMTLYQWTFCITDNLL